MKIKKGYILREVAGNYIVVAVGDAVKNFNGIINLNETGAVLWNFYSEEHTVDEGVAKLLSEYEVAEEIARRDVEHFVNTVVEKGFAE